MFCKNACQKSAQCVYNNTIQAVVSDGTTLELLGTRACDTGVALETTENAFRVLRSGTYRFSMDINFTAGATAGKVRLQLFNGIVPLPCSMSEANVAADGSEMLHVETVIPLYSCCGNIPNISAQVSGLAGSVTHLCANAIKISRGDVG